MRNRVYDDDNTYPYSNSPKEPEHIEDDDSIYEEEYNELMEESEKYSYASAGKTLTVTLVIVGIIALVLVAALFIMSSSAPDADKLSGKADSSAEEKLRSQTESLTEKGEYYISAGDYESAENIYNRLIDTAPGNDEIYKMHSVLFNFNNARSAFDSKNYTKARKFADKIPSEYMYHEILSEEVDDLIDEIEKGEKAYELFDETENLMYDSKYEEALEKSDFIDTDYLSAEDRRTLEAYRENAGEEISSSAKDNSKIAATVLTEFSSDDAYELVESYCIALVEAINNQNFNIVAPYMHSSSSLYSQQKKLVSSCGDQGITERFDGVSVRAFRQLSDSAWSVAVSESETIYYSDGSHKSKTFNWTYTIEYIDSGYYLTKIADA